MLFRIALERTRRVERSLLINTLHKCDRAHHTRDTHHPYYYHMIGV